LKMIFVVVGAVVGLLFVRSFMLDTIEEIGWRMFWDALLNGNFSTRGLRIAIESSTFIKSVIGMAAGGVLGMLATRFAAARKTGR
jgi:hypothetical protein